MSTCVAAVYTSAELLPAAVLGILLHCRCDPHAALARGIYQTITGVNAHLHILLNQPEMEQTQSVTLRALDLNSIPAEAAACDVMCVCVCCTLVLVGEKFEIKETLSSSKFRVIVRLGET